MLSMYDKLGSTDISMYDLLGMISAVALVIFNFSQINKKKEFLSNKSKKLMTICKGEKHRNFFKKPMFYAVVETILISAVQYAPISFLNSKFGLLVSTGANYFGLLFFNPFMLFFLFYYISINPFKQMDLITPAYPIALVFSKLACFCNGCCYGVECTWGLVDYSSINPTKRIPVQLIEATLAFIIFIFLMIYRKKAKEGTLFPIYLIVYSATRFFSEFARHEENVIFGILKMYQLLCIIGVIVGIIQIIVVYKFSNKLTSYFERPVFKWYVEKNIIHNKHKKRKKHKK